MNHKSDISKLSDVSDAIRNLAAERRAATNKTMPYVESPPRKATKEEILAIQAALRTRFPHQFDDTDFSDDELFSAVERIIIIDDYTTDSPGYQGKVAYVTWGIGPEFVSILNEEKFEYPEGPHTRWVHAFSHWDGLVAFGGATGGEFDRTFEVEYSGADHA